MSTTARRAPARRSNGWSWAATAAVFVAFVLAWQGYVAGFNVSEFILPGPATVASATWRLILSPDMWNNLLITLSETVLGFLVAAAVGILLGVLIGKVRALERVLNPFIVATQVVPKVALAPLFIVWFGFGITSKVVIAATLAFFPILTNTVLGIKSIEEGHRQVMATMRASRWKTFWLLEVRSTLPGTLTAMEVGIVLSLIGAVVGEFVGGTRGLGAQVVVNLNGLNVPSLFAYLVILTILGFVLYIAIAGLKRVLIPWHESARVDVSVVS